MHIAAQDARRTPYVTLRRSAMVRILTGAHCLRTRLTVRVRVRLALHGRALRRVECLVRRRRLALAVRAAVRVGGLSAV